MKELRDETAAGCESVSEVDAASLLSVQLEQEADGVFLESWFRVHSGLTEKSSGLEVEIKEDKAT